MLADWRGNALPNEPNKLRSAIVVDKDGMFDVAYPNALLVPLTADRGLIIPSLSVSVDPTAENGCSKLCWAAAHLVTSTSKARIRTTSSRVTAEQLLEVRRRIAMAIGVVASV